jgi:RNA polymerase sigma factor (sigma-70 family)
MIQRWIVLVEVPSRRAAWLGLSSWGITVAIVAYVTGHALRPTRWDTSPGCGINLHMTDTAVRDAPILASTVRLAAAGDEAAFTRLVAEHRPAMARVAFVICGDAESTHDAVQAAWAHAWRRLPTLRDPSLVRQWLIAIVANEARKVLRSRRRRPVVDISTVLEPSGGGDPADAIGIVDLQRALARLEPDDRRLLALRYVAGLDSVEIAGQVGMSASGVRSRLGRLVERLRIEIDHA